MTEFMRVEELLATVKDGDEHGWETEFRILRETHGHRNRELASSILRTGIREPLLIGDDGRLWDGHHRLYAAYWMGYTHVPVKYARPVGDAS